jgi:hypothetical protein
MSAEVVAQHLTIIQFEYFRRIRVLPDRRHHTTHTREMLEMTEMGELTLYVS